MKICFIGLCVLKVKGQRLKVKGGGFDSAQPPFTFRLLPFAIFFIYEKNIPPLISIFVPVRYDDSSDAKNDVRSAISCAVPSLRSG